nr:reverse transcriptase domain-containing protein [Tanacetum cinerariifolium]
CYNVQPLVVPAETLIPNSEPIVAPVIEPVVAPVSAPKPNQKPSIPYPSRLHDQKLSDNANDQKEKFFQIFQDLNFNISFAHALILMPKFGLTIKSLLTNKDKLYELARTPLNEHCSAVLLKKLPEKLGDPDKFLIPCDFLGMDECLALADLGARINLMPLSVWNKLSLPELTPTLMTLELANRSISRPIGVAEDVFVKVGKRSFLKTEKSLIDVYKGELTLRVGKEAITFNLDQTSRYSANYNDMTANQIDVIDMACEEYSQEVLGFSDVIASGNPTPYYDPIISTSSLTLTPFGDSDFLLEEVDAFLALEDDPTSLEELKICEDKNDKSLIDEPPEVELKDLPPHLEYAFLEGDDKLPVIIAKYLSVEEKVALIKVLKSHKQAIAWKLSDIKGINPEFCTHKILMDDDFEPAVQQQRRVNPKIQEVIKKEVLKLLDAGLIYPILDSPWPPVKTTFLFLSWIKCSRDYRETSTIVFLMVSRVTFKFPSMAIFHYMIEKTLEVFMDDFSVFGNSFRTCLSHLEKMLKRCKDTNLCLNWEKSHFMIKEGIVLGHKIFKNGIKVDKAKGYVIAKLPYPTTVKGIRSFLGHASFYRCEDTNLSLNWEKSHFMIKEGIVLGHKISKNRIEVDKAKIDFIAKLPHPTTVKGVQSFLGHAGFYRRFIQDFSKISRPMTHLLEKNTPHRSTNGSNNGLRNQSLSFRLDNRRLDGCGTLNCGSLIGNTLRVVIPFKSSFGLVMVLLGSVPDPEDEAVLELTNLDSILVEITTSVLIEIVPPIEIILIILMGLNMRKTGRSNLICNHLRSETGVGDVAEAEDWFFLSRSNALTISLSSATSDEIAGVEELVLTLATTALARD